MSENDQEHTASPFSNADPTTDTPAAVDASGDAPATSPGGELTAPQAVASAASSTPAGERVRVSSPVAAIVSGS